MVLERVHVDAVAGVIFGVLLLELGADDGHLRLGLRRTDPRLEPCDHLQEIAGPALRLADDERRPEFALLGRKRKARRHDADDREPPAIEVERSSDDIGAAEPPLPQSPADDDDVFLPGFFLVSSKEPADDGPDSKDLEQRGLGIRATDPLRLAVANQVDGRLGKRGHRLERSTETLVVRIVQ